MRSGFPDRAQWRPVDWIPRPRKPAVDILEIVPDVTHECVILSHTLYDVWTHFHYPPGYPRGKTDPCTGERGACWIDHDKTSLRWLGWLHVQRWRKQESRLLRLTPTAIDSEPRLADRSLDLRGMLLKVSRAGKRMNSPIAAVLDPDADAAMLSHPPIDIGEQLTRMWTAPPRRVDERASWAQVLRQQIENRGGK